MNKKIVASIAAGKLASGLSFSCAAQSVVADRPELTLDEATFDSGVLTLPTEEASGSLHVNIAAKKTIDFIIRGIQKTGTVHVFLAYSKAIGFDDQWPTFTSGQGQLELDQTSLKVLSAMILQSETMTDLIESNPLGTLNQDYQTVALPIDLTDLTDIGTDGESIYFQAVAVQSNEAGEYLWETAQASEVDKFIIDEEATDDSNNNGGDGSGGK